MRQTRPCSRAFPNAYIETDEPPNPAFRAKLLALVGLIGITYLAFTILLLHFQPTGYDPVSQAISDYGVGSFGNVMDIGFFAGGAGVAALGLALLSIKAEARALNMGALLLVVVGFTLFAVGVFPTDIEGTTPTTHGLIHDALSLLLFGLGMIGTLLVSYAHGRRWPSFALLGFTVAAASAAANEAFALDASGLVERILVAVLLGWWIFISFKTLKDPSELGSGKT